MTRSGNTYRSGASWRGVSPAVARPRDRGTRWSRQGCGPASFRDRSGIRFRNIRDFAGAELRGPGDNAYRSGLLTRGGGITRSQGLQGTGMPTDKDISVDWEAW